MRRKILCKWWWWWWWGKVELLLYLLLSFLLLALLLFRPKTAESNLKTIFTHPHTQHNSERRVEYLEKIELWVVVAVVVGMSSCSDFNDFSVKWINSSPFAFCICQLHRVLFSSSSFSSLVFSNFDNLHFVLYRGGSIGNCFEMIKTHVASFTFDIINRRPCQTLYPCRLRLQKLGSNKRWTFWMSFFFFFFFLGLRRFASRHIYI